MRIALIVRFMLCTALVDAQPPADTSMHLGYTVLTWNIRYDNAYDSLDRWDLRKEAMAQAVLQRRPQVIGLQEALAHQLDYLKAQWPGYACFGVGREDGLTRGEFSPVLFDTTAFTLLQGRTIWLSPTPDRPSKGWDAACERIATCVILRDRATADSLWVVNTHWDHIGQEARMHSASIVRDLLAPPLSHGRHVLFLGDLNAMPDDAPIHSLQAFLVDSCPIDHQGDGTFNGFALDDTALKRIDYVWCSPKNWQVTAYDVPHPTINGRYDSDHFPVVVVLSPQSSFRPNMPATDPFLDPANAPSNDALAKRIGPSFAMIDEAVEQLRASHRSIAFHWKFSKTNGWHVTLDKGTRRLLYLFPKPADLLLRLVLNERGVERARRDDVPAPVRKQLLTAKKYPEGILLEFTRADLTAEILQALLAIKLAS